MMMWSQVYLDQWSWVWSRQRVQGFEPVHSPLMQLGPTTDAAEQEERIQSRRPSFLQSCDVISSWVETRNVSRSMP